MRIYLKILPDNTVSLVSEAGHTLCNFHTMDHAINFCREWQTSDQEVLYPHDYMDASMDDYDSMDMDVNSASCGI